MGAYETTYRESVDDPARFWLGQAGLVDWIRKPTSTLGYRGNWSRDQV